MYDTQLSLRKPANFNLYHIYASYSVNNRVWYVGYNDKSHVFTSIKIQKLGQASRRTMHQRSCPSIVFWQLLSILSFFVPTHWASVRRWRSVILHDNRFPLMFEFRQNRWLKYITISNIWELSYQGSRDILEINTYQTHIKNHIWGCHVQQNVTLYPL